MIEPSFSVNVLRALRADGYRPRAWGRMLAASWRQSRATAAAHPRLVQDWWWLTAGLGAATLGFTAYTLRRHGWQTAWRIVAASLPTNVLQAGDIYVHLGLHRHADGAIHQRLGTAMTLTATRHWAGAVMGSRLVVGAPLADDEVLVALALIVATDIADGWLARRQHLTSSLGRYLDGEADLAAWTALTLTQAWRGQVPHWFFGAFALRWGLPLVLGFGRAFAGAAPVTLAPSRFARLTGAAQVAMTATTSGAALRAGKHDARRWARAQHGLVTITGVLLVATAARHCARLLRANASAV